MYPGTVANPFEIRTSATNETNGPRLANEEVNVAVGNTLRAEPSSDTAAPRADPYMWRGAFERRRRREVAGADIRAIFGALRSGTAPRSP